MILKFNEIFFFYKKYVYLKLRNEKYEDKGFCL